MMRRPPFLNVLLFLFVKYMIFFMVLALLDSRFKTIVLDNSHDVDGVWINSFFYLIEVLWAIFLLILILIIPLYILLKLKNTTYLLISFFAWVIIEYIIYEYGTSYVHLDKNGVIDGIISVLFLFVFFGRYIISLKSNNEGE